MEKPLEAPELSQTKSIKTAQNEPDIDSQIQQLEFNISQNQNRSQDLSKDCYNLLHSTELLAFDLLFSCFLLDEAKHEEVYSFLEECIRPKFVLSGKEFDFKLANVYVQFLKQVIDKCVGKLEKKSFDEKIEKQKRTSEFLLFLKDQKIRLENEIKRKRGNETKRKGKEVENVKEGFENKNMLNFELSEWLSSKLTNELTPSQEALEIKYLIKCITTRLCKIEKLKDDIKVLKDNLKILKYDDEKINSSPFFEGVKNSCSFLLSALKLLQSQKALLLQSKDLLSNYHKFISDITQNTQKALESMDDQIEKIEQYEKEKQNEQMELQKEISPYLEQIKSLKETPNIDYNNLKLDIYVPISLQQNTEFKTQIQIQQNEIYKALIEQNKILGEIRENDNILLLKVQSKCLHELEEQNQKNDEEKFKKYEENIEHLTNHINFTDLNEYQKILHQIYLTLEQLSKNQSFILKEMNEHYKIDELEAKIKNKKEKINELSIMNYRMSLELGRSELELQQVLEEKLHEKQELDFYLNWLPEHIDSHNKDEVEKYHKTVYCPICKANVRDTILTSCGHLICHYCLPKNWKCPICFADYNKDQIKPFYFQ